MTMQERFIDQYELQQQLIDNSSGEVWKAFDTQQRRYVALKIFHFNNSSTPDFVERFLRETQPLLALNHPNIAKIYDIHALPDKPDEAIYMVMEYIQGQTLIDYIDATAHIGNFPPGNEIVHIISPIAAAIDYAHQQGVIHGAINPYNIMLDKQHISTDNPLGDPKLIGFGSNTTQNLLAMEVHEVYYTAPERVQGHTENARSDIYSLGTILYEMCTGIPPFQGEAANDIMMQHLHATPTPPALINPGILPSLAAVILRSLAKDPITRFSTANGLAVATARALSQVVPDYLSQSGIYRSGSQFFSSSSFNRGASGAMRPVDPRDGATYLSPIVPQQVNYSSNWTTGAPPTAAPTAASQTPDHLSRSISNFQTVQQEAATERWAEPGPTVRSGAPNNNPPAYNKQPVASPPPKARSLWRRPWFIILIIVLLIAIVGSSVTAYVFNARRSTIAGTQSNIAGFAYFVSSGQQNQNSTQGTVDRMQIALKNLPAPAAGKSYYIWLLNDNDNRADISPIMLGTSTTGGDINIYYPGNAQHDDLLANYSRFLITEENAGTTPANPSLDQGTWKYYSAFSQAKAPGAEFSLLDHERHLLSQDPKLKNVNLVGGLDTWLFRNTQKVLEEAGSARDAFSGGGGVPFMRRQLVRILDYLDGSQYVRTEKLPADLPAVLIDPTEARVALLEFDIQNQNPPGYLTHIGNHLREITQSPGVTPNQKALAISINAAIDNVKTHLTNVHNDAAQLIQMTPDQLTQPHATALLNDLFTEANYAFVGQIDPNTNQVKDGVVQIHYNVLRLATFDIKPYQTA